MDSKNLKGCLLSLFVVVVLGFELGTAGLLGRYARQAFYHPSHSASPVPLNLNSGG
jgi:hypothetical protein